MTQISKTTNVISKDAKNQYLTVKFDVTEESTSTAGNTSTVSYSWTATQGIPWSGSTRGSGAELEFKINGSIVANSTIPLTKNSAGGKAWSGSGKTTVVHNSDGKKTVSIEINIKKGRGYANGYSQDNDPYVYAAASESGSLKLTDLDRAPAVFRNMWVNWEASTSVSMGFSVDSRCDIWQYRIKKRNGSYGSWNNISIKDPVNARSCDFNITDLSPSCRYLVQLKVRRWINNVENTSGEIEVSTSNPAAPSVGSVSLISGTYKSLKVRASGFSATSPATISHYDFSRNLGWNDNGLSTDYTFDNLTPNTSYQISVSVVDNYGTRSGNATETFSTIKPPAPNVDGVEIVVTDPFNADVYPGKTTTTAGYSKLDHYEISFDGGRSWINGGMSSFAVRGLRPDTVYDVRFRAVDNYGTYSNIVSTTITTLPDHYDATLKKNGVWGTHKLSRNVKGEMKKVKNLYRKRSGVWVKCK